MDDQRIRALFRVFPVVQYDGEQLVIRLERTSCSIWSAVQPCMFKPPYKMTNHVSDTMPVY